MKRARHSFYFKKACWARFALPSLQKLKAQRDEDSFSLKLNNELSEKVLRPNARGMYSYTISFDKLGHIILGRGFMWFDFAAYAIGIFIGVLGECALRSGTFGRRISSN